MALAYPRIVLRECSTVHTFFPDSEGDYTEHKTERLLLDSPLILGNSPFTMLAKHSGLYNESMGNLVAHQLMRKIFE